MLAFLGQMSFCKWTLNMKYLFETLNINDIHHKWQSIKTWVMLYLLSLCRVSHFIDFYAECRAECHCAMCSCPKCNYVMCRYVECRYTECSGVPARRTLIEVNFWQETNLKENLNDINMCHIGGCATAAQW